MAQMTTHQGRWWSEKYQGVEGTFNVTVPSNLSTSFETAVCLTYKGSNDPPKDIPLEGFHGQDNQNQDRIILRSKGLCIQQTFLFTLTPFKESWHGFYVCVHPYDIGRMEFNGAELPSDSIISFPHS